MIGQHIYIEEDRGQRDRRDGLWISAYYIRDAEGEPFVWTESPEGKTEKRSVRLGDYDEGLGKYEILSGLSELDYIAVPDQEITEGMKASHTLYA